MTVRMDLADIDGRRREFLIGELRILWRQLREAQDNLAVIAGGLQSGAISVDEAIGILHGVDLLALLGDDSL